MKTPEIIPVEYGRSVLAESMIFQGGAEDIFRPIVFMIYLIKVQDRLILADAGCETMPGFDMHDFIGPVKALEKMNIKPEDITDVIITHSHHDHVECVSRFKNAVIYIQRDEYESGRRYFSEGMSVRLFDDEIQICPDVKAIKIGGHTKGSCIVEIGENREKYIIAGDECYMRECLDKRIPTGSSYCPKKSREFIEKYSGSEYTVMLCHDK
jgi:glyoxylase-like metal-dependent hydrolase (beta-lactamase superfamily II)